MSASSSSVPTPTPARSPLLGRVGLAILLILWAVGVFFITQLGIVLALEGINRLGVDFSGLNPAILSTVIAAASYVIALGIVIGAPWLWLRRRTTPRELGIQRSLSWQDFLLAPFAIVGYLLLSVGLVWLATVFMPWIDFEQEQNVGFDQLASRYEYILAFLTLVVIAPIAEELLFRGYLYGKVRRIMPMWLGVLLISIAFGAAHGQWNVAIDTFALSVAMCCLREYTGTIWAGVLVHMIKNGLAYFVLFVAPHMTGMGL